MCMFKIRSLNKIILYKVKKIILSYLRDLFFMWELNKFNIHSHYVYIVWVL